jgi:hypothetical protein
MLELRIVVPLLVGGWEGLEGSRGASNVLILYLDAAYTDVTN